MAKQIHNQGSAKGNTDQRPAQVTIRRDYKTETHSGKADDAGSQNGIETGPKSNFK